MSIQMDGVSLQLVASSLRWLVTLPTGAGEVPAPPGGDAAAVAGTGRTVIEECSASLRGREVFDWMLRIIQHQQDHSTKAADCLLTVEARVSLLELILALLVGRSEASTHHHANSSQTTAAASASSSKRKVPEDKVAAHAAAGKEMRKPRNDTAAGLMGLVDTLLTRLPCAVWLPLVSKFAIGNMLFGEYLMAADPSSSPLLGWPDQKESREARKAGWLLLFQVASCIDLPAPMREMLSHVDAAAGAEAGNGPHRALEPPQDGSPVSHSSQHRPGKAVGPAQDGVGGGCLASLQVLVTRTHQFVECLPPPTRREEGGPEELLVFDPEQNGLRHQEQALVGLKNRRNTCYINAMLQQLFFIPEFHEWLAGRVTGPAEAPAVSSSDSGAPGVEARNAKPLEDNKELSDRLHELFGYLRHSRQKFFDPAEFIKECKSLSRQPPLLDKAHTQDDTMTFLQSLLDALASIHGASRLDLFKVVEKSRRWVDRSLENRSITNHEKEYLMLEIEDGISDIESALRKHFSRELMTGDNRIWNEQTQAKETVWKAPFIEETSLPEVLVVQLKRFKINMTWDGRVETLKLNTKVEFGDTLDLSDYVRHQKDEFDAVEVTKGAHVYELQGIVVHSGQSVNSGHYYSFINSEIVQQVGDCAHLPAQANVEPAVQAPQEATAQGSTHAAWTRGGIWYKLDDQTVTKASEETIKQESFGGTLESKDQFGDVKRQAHSRSAYVLFYRKRPGAAAQSARTSALCRTAEPTHSGQSENGQPNGVGSSKRQRVSKAQKATSANSHDHVGAHHSADHGAGAGAMSKDEARSCVAVEHACPASVQAASLSAALHVLAFDQHFIKWVEDLVCFANAFMPTDLLHSSDAPSGRLPEAGALLQDNGRVSAPETPPNAISSSGGGGSSSNKNNNSSTNKALLAHMNGSPSPRRSNIRRREQELANIQLALAAGIRIPAELVAQICDMAVLTLAHVAARTDSNQHNQPRWRLVLTLVEKTQCLLKASPQGSSLLLHRVCTRCAALQGEDAAAPTEEAGDNIKEGSGGVGEWRSWIETLLLKHPEEKVREGFQRLLKTAVGAYRASADAGPAPAPSAAGKQGAGGPRPTSRRKATPMSANQGACAAVAALKVHCLRV